MPAIFVFSQSLQMTLSIIYYNLMLDDNYRNFALII
jgi:hypothetical protein